MEVNVTEVSGCGLRCRAGLVGEWDADGVGGNLTWNVVNGRGPVISTGLCHFHVEEGIGKCLGFWHKGLFVIISEIMGLKQIGCRGLIPADTSLVYDCGHLGCQVTTQVGHQAKSLSLTLDSKV